MAGYLASERVQGKDKTDLIGPLHLFVGATLVWMLWTAVKASRDQAAAPLPEGV